ncbi:uncharacterized protein LOC114783433 isoform X2 [Denticeps clupeoides]|uniref:uncharacterized protein LOC114783433 isoform X2 n=1 Tax=Denticeps clupeoides TaxID=299321 RepID=UPI0010A4BD78|nr:uncharacterized protein LOC114783433 isoform X2 [Denticeps clupeoides]
MVKCLIQIKTKVNVHLRMINHCYRNLRVRVVTLGPRILGKALGALPLCPRLPDSTPAASNEPDSLKDRVLAPPISAHTEAALADGEAGLSGEPSCPDFRAPPTLDQKPLDPKARSPATRPGRRSAGQSSQSHTPPLASPASLVTAEGTSVGRVVWLIVVTTSLFLAFLLLVVALVESELDVGFLRDVRRWPELQDLHYNFFCPLRRWAACKLRWVGGHLIKK